MPAVGLLTDKQLEWVFHYTPLHYMPFIGRSQSLMSKPSLRAGGFPDRHVRSMSSAQDVARGFGDYVHLTLAKHPPILRAKLAAGFPHVGICVLVSAIEGCEFSLCRFNVAMTRYLRRDGRPGFPESSTNGRYYPGHQIPIAKSEPDKLAMLEAHLGTSTIEVLAHGDLGLPSSTIVETYHAMDEQIAVAVLSEVGARWKVVRVKPPVEYERSPEYAKAVEEFIATALSDPTWRGSGLEFDRV